VTAWDWRDGELQQRWVADSSKGLSGLAKQGAHSLSVADVDSDGKQEIIYGGATVDDDGSLMYSTGLGHGDALHVSDMRPDLPGLEVYMVHENPREYGDYGSEMHNAQTGEIIWGVSGNGYDVGRGVAMDIDPNYPGYEACLHAVACAPQVVHKFPVAARRL
jgi:rhamnogalacturonan endolyase